MPFYPFGPPPEEPRRNAPRPPGGPPPVEEIIAMAREHGMIPGFVHDDEVMVVKMGPGGMEWVGSPGATDEDEDMRWHPGDPLPHTSHTFDDPPYGMSPGQWRDTLVEAVGKAEDADDFRFSLMAALGYDMVHSHAVPVDAAMDGSAEFADWLFDEYRWAT